MEGFHLNTPLLESPELSSHLGHGSRVLLKMDSMQPSGSFKIRGLGVSCQRKARLHNAKHFVIASGGNAGVAVAYSGYKLGVRVTVVIPEITPTFMKTKLESYGAEVILHGQSFDDANELAQKIVKEKTGSFYIHPFDDSDVWDGNSTIIQEIHDHKLMEDMKPAAVVTVCGGGGLLAGIVHGLDRVGWGDVPVIVSETEGADSYSESIKQNRMITLPSISSIAKTLGAKTVCKEVFDMSKSHDIRSVVVSDKLAVDSCLRFADDQRTLVEPACGAGLACLYQKVEPLMEVLQKHKEPIILVIVCGGNMSSLKLLEDWKVKFGL